MYNKMKTSLGKIPKSSHAIRSLYLVWMKINVPWLIRLLKFIFVKFTEYRHYLITERTHKEHWYLTPWKHFVMRHNVTLLWKMNIKGIH